MLRLLVGLFAAIAPLSASAQQSAEMDVDLTVSRPLHPQGQGPVVAVDAAHNNFHTASGRYAPFAEVLRNDGYQVRSLEVEVTPTALSDVGVLVVANALAKENVKAWRLPTPSAFTKAEVQALREWVLAGGSLFLIVDHMPFPGAAAEVASAFGFQFDNSHAMRAHTALELFSRSTGDLLANEITDGATSGAPVTEFRTFAGSSFRAPPNALPVMRLGPDWTIEFPEVWGEFNQSTPRRSATDADLRAGALQFGRGRVFVVSEAAAFSSQSSIVGLVGFGAGRASQNKQFLLNVMHWLSDGGKEAGELSAR
jgi:hypothetical protein